MKTILLGYPLPILPSPILNKTNCFENTCSEQVNKFGLGRWGNCASSWQGKGTIEPAGGRTYLNVGWGVLCWPKSITMTMTNQQWPTNEPSDQPIKQLTNRLDWPDEECPNLVTKTTLISLYQIPCFFSSFFSFSISLVVLSFFFSFFLVYHLTTNFLFFLSYICI